MKLNFFFLFLGVIPESAFSSHSPCHNVNCNNAGKCEVISHNTAKCRCENTFINTDDLLGCVCREGHTFDADSNRCFPPVTPSPTPSPTTSPTINHHHTSSKTPEPPSPCKNVNCNNAGVCRVTSLTTAECQCEDTFINTDDLLGCVCPEGHTFDAGNNRCIPPVTPSPTASPTKSPTLFPTAGPSTALPTLACDDDETATFFLQNFPEKEVTCAWLTKNSKKVGNRKERYCGLNHVKLHCKNSCNFCECEDDSSFTFELKHVKDENGNPKIQDCSWLLRNAKGKDYRLTTYCTEAFDDGAVLNACTKSCGLCPSDE